MTQPNAGRFYTVRMRLNANLSRHRLALGKPFSPMQEDAWLLLNEVEHLAKLLQQVERELHPDDRSEFAHQVRHTVLMHFPMGREGDHDTSEPQNMSS